jgi:uncharacterized membrane protein YdjX (TVP38/TMEM64 family)
MTALSDVDSQPGKKTFSAWRLIPLAAVACGAVLVFALGLDDYLTFAALRENRGLLLDWVGHHGILAAFVFMVIYALGVVCVPPSGTVMTLAGGFVFGAVMGTFYVVVGATLGATILFLVTRLSVGDVLRARAGDGVRRMEAGFHENEMSYMLVLRLIPLFPFWLVNIAPACLGVGLRTFVIGTFVGIIPGTAVFAIFGAGLGSIFDANEAFTLSGVITPEIIAGLVGLAALSLVPVAYKKIKQTKK